MGNNIRRYVFWGCLGFFLLFAVCFFAFIRPGYTQNADYENEPAQDNPKEADVLRPLPPAEKKPIPDESMFSEPVPEAEKAASSAYFDDAVFIGDSRTRGLQLFGGLDEAEFFAASGLMVNTVFSKKLVIADGVKVSVVEALRQQPFQKVYIMLGINELGWAYSDVFIEKYTTLIREIKNMRPDAMIYVQSILPVSHERSQKDEIYNNEKIETYNGLIREMAETEKVYYLDVAECMRDKDGSLFSDASSDGIHLNSRYCRQWASYLQKHYNQ